jgi:glutamine amidotransferase
LVAEKVIVSNDPLIIRDSTHLVLPGVGAFGAAMRKIHERLPCDILEQQVVNTGKPFLGICVGMQVLATRGLEFGEHKGLGWISGTVRKIEASGLPLPHIGWNDLICQRSSKLTADLEDGTDFYFVHSYIFDPADHSGVLATSSHGEEFCAAIQSENIFGVQFHPEKSQRAGRKLIENFLKIS